MDKNKLKLFMGDKHLSSWSMRPWLLMKQFEIPFEEHLIRLDQKGTKAEIAKTSPSGRVPVLIDNDLLIWDSLAICEYLGEKFPRLNLWPESIKQRALARSVCAEMHSGFPNLRKEASMALLTVHEEKKLLSAAAQAEVDRIDEIFSDCVIANKQRGPFLFGDFSIADAFYMPVISRFRSYQITLKNTASASYYKQVVESSLFQMWIKEAQRDL
jgi:glutathione S-transferase